MADLFTANFSHIKGPLSAALVDSFYGGPEYVETVGYNTASALIPGQKTGYFRFSGPG